MDRRPSGTTPHQPGQRRGQQSRHLRVAQTPAWAVPDPARSTAPAGAPQPAGLGKQPEPPPVAEGHDRGATQPTNEEAEPPALPNRTAARGAHGERGRNAGAPVTDTNANTNGGTWQGSGPASNAECRTTRHSGTRRRRGVDR